MHQSTRAYLDFLRGTPYQPVAWMLEYQRGLIEKIVRHACAQVPFYADRLNAVIAPGGRFDMNRWREIPTLTRVAAQQAGTALYAREVPPESGDWNEQQTSGSTGMPLRHRRSAIAGFVNMCVRHRDYEAHKFDFDGAVASIQSMSGDPTANDDAPRRWSFYGRGPMLRFPVRSTVEQQFRWLQGVRAPYLRVYPSLLRALAEHARRLSSPDLKFDAIRTYGENLPEETRLIARETFGARVIHSYGATEAGRLAAECAVCARLHVPAETILLEVLREDGAAARPGESGRVVVTPFYNFAMPLIRYEIGDLAEVGAEGECESLLPTLNRVFGRTRNLFRLPDGSRVWPDTRARDMLRYIGFTQVQVVQTALESIEVRYVADSSGRTPDSAGLQDYFRSVLHPSLNVSAAPVAQIARSPSGKFDDYLSLVG
jgi:phenylacetate-CoA ligase